MALDRRGAELLFQVLTEREEKNSVAIASNESFGGWTKTFTDPRLCGVRSRDRRRAGWAYSPRDVRLWRLAPRFGDAEHWEWRARVEAHRMATGPLLGRGEDAESIEDNRFSPTDTRGA
jgi:hypothetical protein